MPNYPSGPQHLYQMERTVRLTRKKFLIPLGFHGEPGRNFVSLGYWVKSRGKIKE